MKINWGMGLVIVMTLFIGFISFFVYRMTTDHNLEHDLVTEGYYQKEMELQGNIYAEQNTARMKNPIEGFKSNSGYLLQFPEGFEKEKIIGEVFLYRPSNKLLDFELPLKLTNSAMLIPDYQLLEGRWNITINWEYEGTKYRFQKQISY
ncbi:FixH family protein [Mesonia sp. K4-1]|uniref:FixH family protein n=1 Tax=Mesonia sp. K4-1 TaxID=2602760 RepID=UPI0011CB45E1|nr:FixH family protein [Mesonia sp. K4-1]TXK73146.1 cytochrome C oxidase Cbb3 [Mesonia sp. K4-1]